MAGLSRFDMDRQPHRDWSLMRSAVTGDFSQGKVSGQILNIGLPIMAAEFVNVLYNLADRMYIGHLGEGGTAALTGMGVCFPLITLIGAFSNLFSSGGAPLTSIARGEGRNDRAEKILCTAFTLLLATGVLLTLLLFFLSPWLLSVLGGDETTLPYAVSYFQVYVLGTIPVMIGLGMNSFINAQGFPKIGMMTVVIGAAANIVLDPVFIYALGMGVTGAALATVISQCVSAGWVLLFLTGKRPITRLKQLTVDRTEAGPILKLGVTGFTFKVTNSFTQALVNIVLKAWGGALSTLYVGAMSLINSIREIMSLPGSGVSNGASPVMGYNYGARKYKRVCESIRFCFQGGLLINMILWLLMMLVPEVLIRIFTSDKDLIAVTVHCARIYFGVFPLMAMQMTGQNTYVALNYPRYALFFSLLRKAVLIAPLTVLLPLVGLGADGVFWAELFSQLFGATACFFTMYFRLMKPMSVLPDGAEPPEKNRRPRKS